MEEFTLVDKAMKLFEHSSGCKMHRDPTAGKCKFLALGRWKGTLTQEDLPCNFFSLSDHLDMLGVTLMATHTATRKANGDELQEQKCCWTMESRQIYAPNYETLQLKLLCFFQTMAQVLYH